ncbi:hypothetical protein GYMLUDRAFT_250404 [Collybiopsis luxurians FD-317 M1]|uniref:Uncharacterized protein n=1 Tax=Collybiopsis luxurians FD-317 M1 TaxID=944289 RepID=A0A0D0BV44_9AGAR|nr:hypothetical protein GYMLUDRAFT_250404 [Collybiopsis luxurians FD-317 M1]
MAPTSPSKRQSPCKKATKTSNVSKNSSSTSKTTSATKKRSPQHCKQCPDRPLRASLLCIHSKAYNALKRAVAAAGIDCPERASAVELEALLSGPTPTAQQPVMPDTVASSTSSHNEPPNYGVPSTPRRAPASPMSSPMHVNPESSPPNPFTATTPSSTRSYTIQINPRLLQLDELQTLTPSPPPDMYKERKKAAYGHIEGLGRGSLAWEVPRLRPLPEPEDIGSKEQCSHRYRRGLPRLVNCLEMFSASTGCWLYFAALRLGGHSGFQHFTSRRLLEEPDHTLLDELHRSAACTFSSLQLAYRADTQKLAQENHNKDGIIAAREAENEELRARNEAMACELHEKSALLVRLQEL